MSVLEYVIKNNVQNNYIVTEKKNNRSLDPVITGYFL